MLASNGLPPKYDTRMSPDKMFVKRNGNLGNSNVLNGLLNEMSNNASLGDPSTSHLINGL